MTGRQEFFWRGWGPLEPFDRPIAAEAAKTGAVTSIITDHYHYWETNAHGYFEQFQGARLIRGSEIDNYCTDTVNGLAPWAQAVSDRGRLEFARRYYRNAKDLVQEEDFFSPRTFTAACEWLDTNHTHEKFFLWVESFDPHEPFHVPEPYRSMFTDQNGEGMTCWPPYQDGYHGHNEAFWETTTLEEVSYIRAQYMGKLRMVDEWFGKLMAKLDEYDLWKDTAVILTTDHGHELGEKQRFGKQTPLYDLSAHIPLMIWHPEYPGPRRIDALTTAIDLYPTILETLGARDIQSPHGRSAMPLVRGETTVHRDSVAYALFGNGVMITDKEYSYHCTWNPAKPLYWYSATYAQPSPDIVGGKFIPDVDSPVWKIPSKSDDPYPELLFDRRADPAQEHNLAAERPEVVKGMRRKLVEIMREQGVPEEQFDRLMLR